MARRPTSNRRAGARRESQGRSRGTSGRGGTGRGSRYEDDSGRGRAGRSRQGRGGGGSNAAMGGIIAVLALAVIAVVVFVINSDDDDKPKPLAEKSAGGNNAGALATSKTDDIWKSKQNGRRAPTSSKPTVRKRWAKEKIDKSVFRPLMDKVDTSKWDTIDAHLTEARKLKSQALTARKAGKEAEFKHLITKAVKEWRKGDLLSEDFQYEVDSIKDGMWDAMFTKESRKLEALVKEFRGYIKYEN